MIPKQYGEQHLHQGYHARFHDEFETHAAIGIPSNTGEKTPVFGISISRAGSS